jgi:pimeloyl-ACP methyl ester carboxylesterase
MSPRRRTFRRITKAFLPIALVIVGALVAVTVWIVRGITRPPRAPYLVTPETFSTVTGPVLKADDVTWPNHDGTKARGWLIRGGENSPAIILLHGYGADRSWFLNLAAKLHEATRFTILIPDQRGHGENPPVNWSLFGAIEGDDATAAIDYLHTLKTPTGKPQLAGSVGIYGTEMGAYAALDAAKRYPEVRALALDSAPAAPDDVVLAATNRNVAMNNSLLQRLARWGVRIYGFGKYQRTASCDLAHTVRDEHVLLLVGDAANSWRASGLALEKCFEGGSVEIKKDLTLTGTNLMPATGEQEEAYDRPVIEFFDKAMR